MSVTVFGSANADLTVQVPHSPAAGETVTGTGYAVGLGGKGLNQAVAAARFGAPTAFVGRVGDDDHGDMLAAGLAAAGVDVSDLAREPGSASGVALVVLADDGENCIVVVPGANGAVGAPDLARLRARLDGGGVLLVQLELPLPVVEAAVAVAHERGVRVVLDPAPVPQGDLPRGMYAPHVVLTPNEGEAAALVGHTLHEACDAERAARALLGRGVGAVVLKLGARGVCWAEGDEVGWQPALQVQVRDTVGAGDAVNGVLAAALDTGLSLREALPWAVGAGSVAVTRSGACAAMPTRAEVLALLEPA